MRKAAFLTAFPLTLIAGATWGQTLWSTDGFDMPESVLFVPASDHLVVSVMVGAPNAIDGNGHLALLDADGKVIDANWTEGMDAPKGMALVDDRIFVADMTFLRIVDAESGELLESVPAEGAVFLNDVATDGTAVYVSDLMTDTIWRYADGHFEKWLEDAQLSHPNGLYWDEDRLIVGTWGKGMAADFSTESPGSVLAIDPDRKNISTLASHIGNIDGIADVGDKLLLSDWITGKLVSVAEDGRTSEILSAPPGLADISSRGNVVYLPHMLEGRVEAITIK